MNAKRAVIIRKTYITPDTLDIECEMKDPEVLDFKSGQFISVDIPPVEGEEKGVRRAYSIASHPQFCDGKRFVLCIKIVPEGKASMYFDAVQEGAELTFLGPVGHFTLKDRSKDKVFIATGTGIAPFKAMMEELALEESPAKLHLVFGVRYPKDLFYIEYLDTFVHTHDWFSYATAVSRVDDDSWQGYKGRVTGYMESVYQWNKADDFYLCGNGAMIDSMNEMFKEREVEKDRVHFEKYFT